MIRLFQVGTRSDLLKEELNRWTQNYIDVNLMVKEHTLGDQEREVLRSEVRLVLERCKVLETEVRRVTGERDEARAGRERLERQLTETSSSLDRDRDRWGDRETEGSSDHDSGKHSDNSLIQSQDERWVPGAPEHTDDMEHRDNR